MANNKIGLEDLFDLTDIEKGITQTIEYDLLKLMEKWEQEEKYKREQLQKQQEQDNHIKDIVRQVLKEELSLMLSSKGLFNEKFFKELEIAGFERNCIGCEYAQKNYASSNIR